MSLFSYANATTAIMYELRDSLTEDDLATVRQSLRARGREAWASWMRDNRELILQYLCATPSVRLKKVKKIEASVRPFLVVAALIHARRALDLLGYAQDLQNAIGHSNRKVLGFAAECALALLADSATPWIEEDVPWNE